MSNAVAYLKEQLEAIGFAREFIAPIAAAIADVVVLEVPGRDGTRPQSGGGLIVPGVRFVIADDDYDLLKAVNNGATAYLAANQAANASQLTSSLTSFVCTSLTLLRDFRRKGALLENDTFDVLCTLRGIEPTTSSDIAGALSRGRRRWSSEDVERHLSKLQNVVLGDGTSRAFVVADDGLWRSAGV
jgi:hypothetical protein